MFCLTVLCLRRRRRSGTTPSGYTNYGIVESLSTAHNVWKINWPVLMHSLKGPVIQEVIAIVIYKAT